MTDTETIELEELKNILDASKNKISLRDIFKLDTDIDYYTKKKNKKK